MTSKPNSRGRLGAAIAAIAAIAVAATTLTACAVGPSEHRQSGRTAHESPTLLSPGLIMPTTGPRYYLALGDSLSRGVQPAQAGPSIGTRDGYPQQLDIMLRRHVPGLRLVVMGCSGETTSTMIHGGICPYPRRSQLAQASAFLRAHRGQVALITIDIGANDPNSCVQSSRLAAFVSCLSARMKAALYNMGTILGRLRSAGGRGTLIVGMTYYVPELGLWLNGGTGMELAVLSERLALGYGRLLTGEYHRFGARVADVFGAFSSGDFTRMVRLRGHGAVPRNVAVICSLTWMCARPPRGPNEHANAVGYGLIAKTFWRAISS